MSDPPPGLVEAPRTTPSAAPTAATKDAPTQTEAATGYLPGTLVNRYVVVKLIGSGGMGAVMLAYDTALARRVALKVMLTSVASEEARERMLREAQAMARLSHPNVVGIYDVGVHEGNVFLAMEYIDGMTLRDWLNEPRSRRDVLTVMKQAGRGLAAAHHADIVHRDFKPANVIVANDGQALVLDFGIARGVKGNEASAKPPKVSEPFGTAQKAVEDSQRLLDHTLTEEGSLLGTVGYAAPEVLLGLEVDARADVFSFSVTLWRAVCGTMPFPSQGLQTYVEAVFGSKEVLPPGRNAPRWLRDVMLRGLEREKGARFRSMDEMLAALEADPWKKRILLAGATVATAAAASVVAGKAHHDASVRAECRAEGAAIAASWNTSGRDSAQRAMLAEADEDARERTTRTLERLDEYERAWATEQTVSCEATRVTKTQSEAEHEKRSQCLLEDRMQFEVVSELLASDDHSAHRQSLAASSALPVPRLCTAAAAEKMSLTLPKDPILRAKILEARRELLRADLLRLSTEVSEARRAAEHAIEVAVDVGDGALEARGEYALGKIFDSAFEPQKALQHQRRALIRAESVGADHFAGLAAASATHLLVNRMRREDDARLWLELAHAFLARLGEDKTLEFSILLDDIFVERKHDPRGALEASARALELAKSIFGDTQVYCSQLANQGVIFYDGLGDAQSFASSVREAIECYKRVGVPRDSQITVAYVELAEAERALGHWDDAIRDVRRGAQAQESLDPQAPVLVATIVEEALDLDGAAHYEEAERRARHALEFPLSGDVYDQTLAYYALGLARAGQGDAEGARAACTRSIEVDTDTPDPAKVYPNDYLRCVGEAELALGEIAAARQHLEQSVALTLRLAPGDLAVTRFALARALCAGTPNGRPASDIGRATALALQARSELREVVKAYPFRNGRLDEVEHWLAEHGRTPPP